MVKYVCRLLMLWGFLGLVVQELFVKTDDNVNSTKYHIFYPKALLHVSGDRTLWIRYTEMDAKQLINVLIFRYVQVSILVTCQRNRLRIDVIFKAGFNLIIIVAMPIVLKAVLCIKKISLLLRSETILNLNKTIYTAFPLIHLCYLLGRNQNHTI